MASALMMVPPRRRASAKANADLPLAVGPAMMRRVRWLAAGEVKETKSYKERKRKKELLFVNKKKQKNFIGFNAGRLQHRAKRSKKVFGSCATMT